MSEHHPQRPLIGYGDWRPQTTWPGGARLALSFVVNYEEGGELSIANGDDRSESRLADLAGLSPAFGQRDPQVESLYEYGSRVGVWRLLEFFEARQLPFTLFGVGRALELNPRVAEVALRAGADLVPHGWRWIDYRDVPAEVEADHIGRCVELFTQLTGRHPLGWYTGRTSANTRRLVVEEGSFLYDSDAYNDDIPYWEGAFGRDHLVVPYALDTNDGRLAAGGDFATAGLFFEYLRDSFDWLYEESARGPRMMSVGLHCRVAGRAGRMRGLSDFVAYVQRQAGVWICARDDIARHWASALPPGQRRSVVSAPAGPSGR